MLLFYVLQFCCTEAIDVLQKEKELKNWVVKFDPANFYLFKVSNRNTKKSCEIYSKLTIETPKRRH